MAGMESAPSASIYFYTTQLIIQLFVIITAALVSDMITKKLALPRVIGYITAGILLGPWLLGTIPFGNLFPEGMFGSSIDSGDPTTGNIGYIAIVASVMLLFSAGLETDVTLFLRYAAKGSVVGLGGLAVSFFAGYYISMLFFPGLGALHPTYLFMGTIATATSVSITSSILSSRRKVSSPEGVTTLSAAVIDDVVGMILLAVVSGVSQVALHETGGEVNVLAIALRAVLLWIGFTTVGILFARKFGRGLKKIIGNQTRLAVFCLGLAFFIGGLFETASISMIIGAYVVGLTLSNTDLSYVIQEKLAPIFMLFVPVFFVVSGMSLDLNALFAPQTLLFGLVYTAVCIAAKFFGAGLPAFGLGFNALGATRIGLGMIPRGEVALIIATIGLGANIIQMPEYSAIMIMIVISSFAGPILLNLSLASDKRGTVHPEHSNDERTEVDFKQDQLARFIISDFLTLMEEEGFFVNKAAHRDRDTFHIRKDNMFITLHSFSGGKLVFLSDKLSIPLFKTALYEAAANIAESAQSIKDNFKPTEMVASRENTGIQSAKEGLNLTPFIASTLVDLKLRGETKKELIAEMVSLLDKDGCLSNEKKFLADVLEREKTFSTGLQNGVAVPHARSESCKKPRLVIGLKPGGVDFQSLDGLPSSIFILIAAPKNYPHVSILAKISSLLNNAQFREKVLACKTKTELLSLFKS